jgi:hypothetical protein
MKKMLLLLNIAILSFGFSSIGQTDIPKGFEKGNITLANGTSVSGYVKDQIHRSANIYFYNPTTGKKQLLDGNDLTSIEINNNKYLCLYGDFFKILSNADPILLQKSSDASGKVIYNGAEPSISKGSDGKIDDQFQYTANTNELKPVPHKKG